jgi:hypothetical protein
MSNPQLSTGVRVRAIHRPRAWLLELGAVTVEIDGLRHKTRWGETFYPLTPGSYEVAVSCKYMFARQMGRNMVDVVVTTETPAIIEWCAPRTVFQKGTIMNTA